MARKAPTNAVVRLHPDEDFYGVVVEYRNDMHPYYRIIQTDALGRKPHGPAKWYDADEFTPTGRRSIKTGRLARRIVNLFGDPEMRGCDCQCCPHLNGAEDEPD